MDTELSHGKTRAMKPILFFRNALIHIPHCRFSNIFRERNHQGEAASNEPGRDAFITLGEIRERREEEKAGQGIRSAISSAFPTKLRIADSMHQW